MSDPPRLDRKIIGFRTWSFKPAQDGHAARLFSVGLDWSPGINEARCEASHYDAATSHVEHSEPAPHPDCSCGLYAWHAHSPCGGADVVMGAIAAWGRIEVHPSGFRAQYAEPVVLAYDESQPWRLVEEVRRIASDWGIPYVDHRELDRAVAEFGVPVPAILRPKAEPPSGSPGVAMGGMGGIVVSGNTVSPGGVGITVGPGTSLTRSAIRGGATPRVGQILSDLRARPIVLQGVILSNAHLRLGSGARVTDSSMDSCVIEQASFHPGRVAATLLSVGIMLGAVAEVVVSMVL